VDVAVECAPHLDVDVAPLSSVAAGAAPVDDVPISGTTVPELLLDVPVGATTRTLPDNLIVYTRTPRRQLTDPLPPPAVEFIGRVSKDVDAIVHVPVVHKRRAKTAGPVSLPRRSRRIAKLPPEVDITSAATICRKLGLADDDGRISDEALDRYSKFYRDLPNRDHVEALAALFGWAVPSDDQLGGDSAPFSVC